MLLDVNSVAIGIRVLLINQIIVIKKRAPLIRFYNVLVSGLSSYIGKLTKPRNLLLLRRIKIQTALTIYNTGASFSSYRKSLKM